MRKALVLGGANCVWSDIDAALSLAEFDGVVTCNDVTAVYPGKIDAAASLHANLWPRWIANRDARGYERPGQVLGHDGAKGDRIGGDVVTGYVDFKFPGQDRSGSSGLFALKVALVDLGYDRAVLCGVPMTPAGKHFFDPKDWRGAAAHQKGWVDALPHIKDRTRSMSGWTRDLLGAPDEDWLA